MERQPEQALLVAAVDRIAELEEELLAPGVALVGERPDLGLVLLDDEQPVAAVVGVGQGHRSIEA